MVKRNFISKRRNPFISKAVLSDEIKKQKLILKDLNRLKRLQRNFNLSRPTTMPTSRGALKRKIASSKIISSEAKNKVKIFKIKNPKKRGSLLIAGIPKGIKLRPIRK